MGGNRCSSREDLVCLDGPRGLPVPQVQCCDFYPRVRARGLLDIVDIQIPSIRQMHRFLRRDRMWRLRGVLSRTAFLGRTSTPMLDPFGDAWQARGYNCSRRPASTAWIRAHDRERVRSLRRRVRGPD